MRDNGIASTVVWLILVARVASDKKDIQKGDKAQGENEEASEIGETASSEDMSSHIVNPVTLGIGIVEVVIGLYVAQRQIRAPSRWVR